MKLKPQIKYLFTKQVLESDDRNSMENVHLILKVEKRREKVLLSDGFNEIELHPDPLKNSKKKFCKIKESTLIDNHLYIFENCEIKLSLVGESISIRLQCSEAKCIMPYVTKEEAQSLPILEDGLMDYERQRIERRVS